MRILIDHVGYLTHGSKFFVVEHPVEDTFALLDRNTLQPVFAGKLTRVNGDLVEAFVGDFSAFTTPGAYLIECPGGLFDYPTRSQVVVISNTVYRMPMRTMANYFTLQRCGDTYAGWRGEPCHTADALCEHTGLPADLTGGWHQSCDLRKWVASSSWPFYALAELAAYAPLAPVWGDLPLQEARWGNAYFQKLIQPDGRLYDSVIFPNDFVPRKVFGDHPPYFGVFNVIVAQCLCARMFAVSDAAYADRCRALGEKVYAFYTRNEEAPDRYDPPVVPPFHDFLPKLFIQNYKGSALFEGDRCYAALALYEVTGKPDYLADAVACADALVAMQDCSGGPCDGAFFRGGKKTDYISTTDDGALGPIALLRLAQRLGDAGDKYLASARRYAGHLLAGAGRNPYGLIPCYWYTKPVPGSRAAGQDAWYRYFADDYAFGCNKEILGRALFLLALFEQTGEAAYQDAAARTVNFVLGVNMLNASTVEGVGRNQPQRLINTTEFEPKTPQIPGAVMTGIAGWPNTDEPYVHISLANEYDMPATSFMLLLLTRLQKMEDDYYRQ